MEVAPEDHSSGSVIYEFDVTIGNSWVNSIRGVTSLALSDSSFCIVADEVMHIYTIDANGQVTESVINSPAFELYPIDLVLHDDQIVLLNNEAINFIQLDGTLVKSLEIPSNIDAKGITFKGQELWAVGQNTTIGHGIISKVIDATPAQFNNSSTSAEWDYQTILYDAVDNVFVVGGQEDGILKVQFLNASGGLTNTISFGLNETAHKLVANRYSGNYFLISTKNSLSKSISQFSAASTSFHQGYIYNEFLSANQIKTVGNVNGSLFWDYNNAQYYYPADSATSTIFTSNIWYSYIDPNDEPRANLWSYSLVGGSTYSYLIPGPLETNHRDAYRHTLHVNTFKLDWVQKDLMDGQKDWPWPTAIVNWPAKGNEGFYFRNKKVEIPDSLAPFEDADNDGLYNPLKGDLPYLKGDEMVFWIMRDTSRLASTQPQLDMLCTLYGYEDANSSDAINRTTFYDVTYRNHSNSVFSDFRSSLFIDFDLGCLDDDYLATIPSASAGYVYNQNFPEVDCNFTDLIYSGIVPSQSVYSVLDTLQGIMVFKNPTVGTPPQGTTDPTNVTEATNMMRSIWRDGTPITVGGDGYNPGSTATTTFMYADSPSNPNGWSMCTASLPFSDDRMLLNHKAFEFEANSERTFTYGFSTHTDIPQSPCGNFHSFITSEIAAVKDYYNQTTSSIETPKASEKSLLSIFPNPATEVINIDISELKGEEAQLSIYSVEDKRIFFNEFTPFSDIKSFSVKDLPKGLYIIQIQQNDFFYNAKFLKE